MFALGEDFFAAGMLDRAESVFEELLESNVNKWISKAAICNSLRTIFEQTQEWQKAIEATGCAKKFHKTADYTGVKLDYDSLISHYNCELALLELDKGNLHEVSRYLKEARKASKQSTRATTVEGDVAFHQKDFKSALKHYLNAVKQDCHLLGMLATRLEESALAGNNLPELQKKLLQLYDKNQDKTVLSVILMLAKKHRLNDGLDMPLQKALTMEKLNVDAIYKASDYLKDSEIDSSSSLDMINQALSHYLQGVPTFICVHCGYKMHDYLWRCPACNSWDTVDQT